ncbi:MAG: hypothetical protein AAB217_23085 [Chloroflexota bacterium]
MSTLVGIATVLSGIATAVVGWFAWVQLRRDKEATNVRRLGAASRASASAYLLRRRLSRWLGSDDDNFDRWLRDAQNRKTLDDDLESAIEEARIALAEVGELPSDDAAGLRNAFVLLLEGIRRLQEHAAESPPHGVELFAWIRKRTDARTDLSECVQLLEGCVIDEQLLDGEHLLRDKRELEEPFGQLARAIAVEGELQDAADQLMSEDPQRRPE